MSFKIDGTQTPWVITNIPDEIQFGVLFLLFYIYIE
jgi:hypothetical protein